MQRYIVKENYLAGFLKFFIFALQSYKKKYSAVAITSIILKKSYP